MWPRPMVCTLYKEAIVRDEGAINLLIAETHLSLLRETLLLPTRLNCSSHLQP